MVIFESGSFIAEINRLNTLSINKNTGLYVEPTAEQLNYFGQIAQELWKNNPENAATLAINVGYEIVRFADLDTGNLYLTAREILVNGVTTKGWGSFFVNVNSRNNSLVEVPHVKADVNTHRLGAIGFRDSGARGFLMAGAHRDANGPNTADVADLEASVFNKIHSEWIGASPESVSWQIHGYNGDNYASFPERSDVILSNGDGSVSEDVLALDRLIQDMGFKSYAYNTLDPLSTPNMEVNDGIDGRTFSPLAGTTNIQGRFSRSKGSTFIHAEFEQSVRMDEANLINAGQALSQSINLSALDATPPSIAGISIKDNVITLRYSEVVGAAVSTTAFSVATVNASNQASARTVKLVTIDPSDPSQVLLVIDGSAPASTVNLRISYADPTGNQVSGVVQDQAGNDAVSISSRFADTFVTPDVLQSGVEVVLADQYKNLILAGSSAINGTGNTLNNTITGNSANNVLNGSTGADVMIGGGGNDTYVVDNVADVVTEAAAAGVDTVQSSVSHTLAANVENLTLTGSAAINGTGNELANTLTGNAANNVLDGKEGGDRMVGGRGNDTYVVDHAADVVVEASSAGTDTVQSSVSHTLAANVENLTLTGSAAINGTGNTAANVLTGNAGNNVLDGKAGADTMRGGGGDDAYVVDNALDRVEEGVNAGTDTVQSSVSHTLSANVENLTLTGSAAISGTGNALDNILIGNAGSNVLIGGVGGDVLTGLGGSDTFKFGLLDSQLSDYDQITDLVIGVDRIDGPNAVSAANVRELGRVSALTEEAIAAVLTPADFLANQAATFTYQPDTDIRTFLALNNGISGFSAASDAVAEITGYSGSLTSLAII